LPTDATFFASLTGTGTFQIFVSTAPPFTTFGSCAASVVPHGFLNDWLNNPVLAAKAQSDIAEFVTNDTLPLRVQHP